MVQTSRRDDSGIEQQEVELEISSADPAFLHDSQPTHSRLVRPTNAFARFLQADVDQSVASRFEQQAAQYPEQLAIKDKTGQFTYSQLNQFSNKIARSILAQRPVKEEPIALLFEQGANFIAAIFGTLKTGKCYVPIDPSFPEARNAYILEDSQAELVVTNSANFDVAVSLAAGGCQILNIDTIPPETATENLDLTVSPDALAYIIYTSGSTGKPKGVFQNNRNLLHNCMNQTNAFQLGVGDRMPLVHSCSVMGAVRVIYNALLNGVSLYPLDVKAEGLAALCSLLSTEKITVFHSVATLFRHFADIFSDADRFPYLRLVILGGEAMSRKDVELYKRQFPDNCLLCTGLGSTEAGTIRVFMLNKQSEIESSLVPPGYAVEDLEVLLLDEAGQEVAAGEVGEIVVKSEYLALGYWRRPDLTEAAFLPDPQGSPARLLKTGDMGYVLPDGCLVHAGRKDFQVKIRGYRVNVSEIEMALLDYGFIKEAVVAGREDASGEMYLVAYVVPRQRPAPSISELRHFIAQKLPGYMIPARFIILEALPQTANGKIDRRSLPAPEPIAPELSNQFVAPRDAIEQQVAEVWANVLRLERVGVHDSFLELGGNSLLGMQMISRLRDIFQVQLVPQILFEAPTIADLSARITQLQADPTQALQTVDAAQGVSTTVIPRRQNQAAAPLSFSQQRLWVFEQLEQNSATYVVTKALRLKGVLDRTALQKTFEAIVARHEILRTNFLTVNGEPVQVVKPPRSVALPVIDLSHASKSEQATALQQILDAEDQRPFDLATDLMLRVALVCLTEQEHILVLVRHHLASDGWSLGIIWQEISALYAAYLSDRPAVLPELPVQFADFAAWERQWLSGEVLETQLNYWRQQLTGAPALLQLPTDRPRPPIQTFNGQTESFQISQELSEQLQVLSRRSGATMYMTLLTAFVTLLARYSGQQDVVVGSMVANRNQREIEPLIGFFSNLLVLRTQLDGNPTFSELLKRVRQTALEAFTHKDVPFEQLTAALKPERSPSHTPWFQVLFMLQNFPMERPELPGLVVTPVVIEESAKYDLTLTLTETATGLVTSLAYNTDLFDSTTIHRLIGHFQTLLEAVVANPELPVFNAPLLTSPERQQLLVEWNNTQSEYPDDRCIHQQFEAQVERTPDAIAVRFSNQALTYRELNQQSNQLAQHLRSLGITPDSLVGICVERSLEMVVAMLAVLKAGGAYVPLDPAYPRERIAYVLENAQVSVLLTQSSLVPSLPGTDAHVLRLDSDRPRWATQPTENLPNLATPDHLAYVIYTSGSTGNPKGVQIIHSAVVNFLVAIAKEPGIQPGDVLLAVTTLSFDIAVLELFAPLMVGAQVVIAHRTVAADGYQLAAELDRSQITILQATPATWRMLLDSGWQGRSELKMLCGGEALPRELANQLLPKGATLWNMYGPTETTIWSAVSQVEHSEAPVYVGQPIANTQFYVLDEQRQPVPIGVPGELYIGGAGLARGYFNRPDLTAEKFIPHPFVDQVDQPEARLYRAGDRVRYRADGSLEFLGRVDYQVKIRGFRIELGEIETVLSQHPAIAKCVVIDREDTPGDRRLVAYLVCSQVYLPPADEFRRFLQKKLPDYMVPSAFVALADLPLTPNGKVDRRALPKPDVSQTKLSAQFVAPRDQLETQLTSIWEEIMGVQPIGVTDNFFDLGGHSLLAVRLFAQIEKTFGKALPLATLFQSATIAELAQIIREQNWLAPWSSLVPMQPKGSKPPLFYMHAGGGNLLVYRELTHSLGDDQPVYGLQPRGLDGKFDPFQTIEDMADYYLAQILAVQPEGSYFLAGLSTGGMIAFELAQRLREQGKEVALLAMFDTIGPDYPKLLPLLPRLASVVGWFMTDQWQRLAAWPQKLIDQVKQEGVFSLGAVMLRKLGLLQQPLDEDLQIQKLRVESKLKARVEEYQRQAQGSGLKKWVDTLIIQILQHSSRPYYADLFTGGLIFQREEGLPELLHKVRDANRDASRSYSPQPYEGHIVYFRASERPPGIYSDPQVGWGKIATNGMTLYEVPGSHTTLIKSPLLAENLKACLEEAQKQSQPSIPSNAAVKDLVANL